MRLADCYEKLGDPALAKQRLNAIAENSRTPHQIKLVTKALVAQLDSRHKPAA